MMCSNCKKQSKQYGTTGNGEKYCFDCCAIFDKNQMEKTGKITLYLSVPVIPGRGIPVGYYQKECKVTNWPGTLEFKTNGFKKGKHNIAGTRYDVWFKFNNKNWHGVQYGENTQLCHCKQLKG